MSRSREHRHEPYEPEIEATRRGGGMRQLIVLLTVAFMVTLGVVVGMRLSSDAIAVLVGVIAGVAASIPCALLLMAVTRRQEAAREPPYLDERELYAESGRDSSWRDSSWRDDPRRAMPPIIVVTPGQSPTPQLGPWATGQDNWSAWGEAVPSRSRREFRVMGCDESEDED